MVGTVDTKGSWIIYSKRMELNHEPKVEEYSGIFLKYLDME